MHEYLYKYLRELHIPDDKLNEFKVQVVSHPHYPSLISISDTLSFLGINNIALNIKKDEIQELPELFVGFIKKDETDSYPELFKKKKKSNELFVYDVVKKKFQKSNTSEILENWTETVYLVEGSSERGYGRHFSKVSLAIFMLLSVASLFLYKAEAFMWGYFLITIGGLYVSLQVLNEVYTGKIGGLKKLCSMNKNTSCNQIISSKKWKLFKYINFSDLALYLFSLQLVVGFVAVVLGKVDVFAVSTLFALVLFGIPGMSLSLYFQKFVEKKWCPLCLLISLATVLEIAILGYMFSKLNVSEVIMDQDNIMFFVLTAIIIFGVLGSWIYIKNLLKDKKFLKESFVKASKTTKNYSLFKLGLFDSRQVECSEYAMIVGSSEADLVVTFVTNPFCSFCKDVFETMYKTLHSNGNDIRVNFILLGYNDADERSSIFEIMAATYFEKGSKAFLDAYMEYLNTEEVSHWVSKYSYDFEDLDRVKEILKEYRIWSHEHKINFTPTICINDYMFPRAFDYDSLKHFMPYMVSDKEFEKRNDKIEV